MFLGRRRTLDSVITPVNNTSVFVCFSKCMSRVYLRHDGGARAVLQHCYKVCPEVKLSVFEQVAFMHSVGVFAQYVGKDTPKGTEFGA